MNELTPATSGKSMFCAVTMAAIGLVLIFAHASPIHAQWTTGTNINNTNTGNVGIGTASSANGKLVVQTAAGTIPAIARFEQLQTANDRGGYISFGGGSDGSTSKGYIGFGKSGTGGATLFANELPNAFSIRSENALHLGTSGSLRMTIDAGGNVGLGTSTPAEALHLFNTSGGVGQMEMQGGGSYAGFIGFCDCGGLFLTNNRNVRTGNNYNNGAVGAQIVVGNNGDGNTGDITFQTVSSGAVGTPSNLLRIKSSGNVGIGTTAPSEKLEVSGNIKVTGTGNIDASGTITAGNIVAKYQDVAEWVESSQALPAGTVVVLDHNKSNQVIASSQSYDTRVAGVISAQPGITLGEQGDNKVLVATTGRVRLKVDASSGPIQVGDLLVTSDIPGVAMKSQPLNLNGIQLHRPGTLLGKALEPLAKGTGEMLVLLSLQ